MCGIAGSSFSVRSDVDRTRAAHALLAAIAERGADAVGYGYRCGSGSVVVHKQRGSAGAALEHLSLSPAATDLLLHVRDYTKGHPSLEANNHPVRHGAVVGIHNGAIQNDDLLFARYGFDRASPGMTVDSEVIFAVAEATGSDAGALEQLSGTMAAAWLDERVPGRLYLARGFGRPLWLGAAHDATFFASTQGALEILERYARLDLDKREVAEGTLLTLEEGRLVRRERFRPDPGVEEDDDLPSVRAPHEGMLAMQRLAAMYST